MSENKALERAEIIAALRCCQNRQCAVCLYQGRSIACKYSLMGAAAALLERDAEEPNEPLTLTELRGMDGEPVWVVFEPDADADRLTMWALVNIIGN